MAFTFGPDRRIRKHAEFVRAQKGGRRVATRHFTLLVSAREVDGRSDLYSLGVVLYESLTGNLPFRSHTFSDLVEHHLYSEPPPMSQVSMAPTNIPRPVKNVVLKCLAKDRTRRYQDALELERALGDAVNKAEEEENEPAMQRIGETP